MTIRTIRLCCANLLLAVAGCSATADPGETLGELAAALDGADLTPTSDSDVSDQYGTPVRVEGINQVHDGDLNTKLLIYGKTSDWIQYRTGPAIISSYSITSANDAPERDPRNWTFEGSDTGSDWTVLDQRQDQTFASRQQTASYSFANTRSYNYYRLNISAVNGGGDLQLAELRIGGTRPALAPGAPTVTGAVADSTSITVNWTAASNAASYVVLRYSDDGLRTIELPSSGTGTSFTDTRLVPGSSYVYKVQAVAGGVRGPVSANYARATTPSLPGGLKDVTARSSYPATDDVAAPAAANAADNDQFTDWRGNSTTAWLQQRTPVDAVVTQYTMTSSWDRNAAPKDWTLQGSADGSYWVTIDSRTNQSVIDQYQTRTFSCNPTGLGFNYYRLRITATAGGAAPLLAEWRLLGATNAALGVPAAPSAPVGDVAIQAVSGNQIILKWADNAGKLNPESSYRIDRATDSAFTQNLVSKSAAANSTYFPAVGLDANRTYYFRIAAVNSAGSSAAYGPLSATTLDNTPPLSYVENGWYGGHNRTLNRVFFDGNVAIYADQWVPNTRALDWLRAPISEAWTYIKNTYGNFGDPYLYVIANQANVPAADPDYGWGGGQGSVFDSEFYYRNTVFLGSEDWSISDPKHSNFGATTHEIAHVIEWASNGLWQSPAYAVWDDSRWAEIYQYDLYLHLTSISPTAASFIRDTWMNATDDQGHYWFRDWYYPLYNGSFGNTATDKKGSAMLARFFQLLSQVAPTRNGSYQLGLNMGQYVHLMSGAVGVDLEDEAKAAFTWTPQNALELAKAQADWPTISALYRGNLKPGFTFDPVQRYATLNVALTGQTLASTATDPNAGDTLTYSKVSGASWLTVAANGTLGGTPTVAGTSSAVVRVTDQNGLSDTATVTVTVLPAPVTLLSDGFETDFNLWTDATTTVDWDRATDQKRTGSYAARCGVDDTNLTSDVINTSGKQFITISFWYRDAGVDDDDQVFLQLFDGSVYRNRFELGLSAENAWQQYSVTLNASRDAAFFRSNFRLRIAGTSIDSGENLWIDDVRVTAQ